MSSLPMLLGRITAFETGNAEQALLTELTRPPATEAQPPRLRQPTLDALWSWYLDGSQTARATIADAKLRKVSGFGRA